MKKIFKKLLIRQPLGLDPEPYLMLIPIQGKHFINEYGKWWPVFRIRNRSDLKLFGLTDLDPDPKLLISDPAPDPPLFHTKLRNMFLKCTKK